MTRRLTAVFGVTTALLIAVGTAGAEPSESSIRQEIEAAVDVIQAAVESGKSAATVAELLYTEDVVIVGEGGGPAVRGKQAALEEMEAHWASLGPGGVQRCKLALADDPGVASAETYASFFVLHCKPNPPVVEEHGDVRGIYVWKKLPQGWRVAIEQWGVGKLQE